VSDLDLQRLLDDPQADLSEVTLLRAGKSEVMSDETRHKVLAGIGVGGAALGLAASSSLGKASWPAWLKTGLLLSALGGIAGTLAFLGLGSDPSKPATTVTPQQSEAAQPQTVAVPPSVPTAEAPVYQATDLPVAPSVGSAKVDKAQPGAPGAAGAEPSLAAEMDAIRPAKARLASGDAQGALAQLRQYRAQFPAGRLGVEATVIEVEALVASGQRGAAEKLAAPLINGDSPYAARLRSLLGSNSASKP
jgi:hypothetical protein